MLKRKNFLDIYTHWPLMAFLIITIIVFRKVVFCNYISINPGGDGYCNIFSWSYYFVWAVKNGILPFWDITILCGQPFGTDPPCNFNVLNPLSVIFGPKTAWSIRHILCFIFAGYFTYSYAKYMKISNFGSFVCGAIFMFTHLNKHIHTVSFLIPLILLCLERAVRIKRNMWIVFASILTAIYYFNSNPQYALYIFMFSCCYLIYRHYCISAKVNFAEIFRSLSIFAVLTFGISAIQFFRAYEVSLDSQRTISFHTKSYYWMLPTNFITTIIPHFYESPFKPDEMNFFFGRFWKEAVKKFPVILGQPFLIYAPYVSVFGFIMGILAFLKRKPRSVEKFFGWFAVIIIVFMSTSFFWHIIIVRIPILNQMHQIQRSFIIYEFSLAILAGVGVDILLHTDNKRLWQGAIKWISRIILFVMATVCVIFSIVHFFIYYNKDYFFETGNNLIGKYIIGNPLSIGPPELYDMRLNQLYQFFCSWTNVLNPSVLISIIIITISVFVLYLFRRGMLRKPAFCLIVSFLILGDLFVIQTSSMSLTRAKEIAPVVRTAEYLRKQPGIFRVFRLQDERNLLKPMEAMQFLRPNTNTFYGLSSIEGSKSLMEKRYVEFIGILEEGADNTGNVTGFQNFNPRIISLMNVKYIVTSNSRRLGKGFKLVHIDPEYRVYENKRVLPRAFMVYNTRFMEDDNEILETLLDPNFELAKEIILEEKGGKYLGKHNFDSFSGAQVQIISYEPHSVHMEIDTPKSGYLFFGDCFDPGWRVYVDGKRDKIYRADYAFRAVELSEGKHSVSFIYKPFSIKLGLIFNSLSLLMIVCIFLKERQRR